MSMNQDLRADSRTQPPATASLGPNSFKAAVPLENDFMGLVCLHLPIITSKTLRVASLHLVSDLAEGMEVRRKLSKESGQRLQNEEEELISYQSISLPPHNKHSVRVVVLREL